jgi:hypothetical protein
MADPASPLGPGQGKPNPTARTRSENPLLEQPNFGYRSEAPHQTYLSAANANPFAALETINSEEEDLKQKSFVEGQSILDNTFLAQEAQEWAEESNQDLVLLLLDFKKAFDRIEWSFLFEALAKLGFCPKWIRWVSSLYTLASSTIKLNGVEGNAFPLTRSVR